VRVSAFAEMMASSYHAPVASRPSHPPPRLAIAVHWDPINELLQLVHCPNLAQHPS